MYGWINAGSITRIQEAESGQQFEVGYIKTGTLILTRIDLTIIDEEGTASILV